MTQAVARTVVFATSAAVLVIEILAQRLLAPYLGVSLEVVTGVIGVVLAGIAVGAWAGGRAADRMDPAKLLGPLLIAGGLSALASPLIVDIAGPAISSAGPLGIVVLTTVGFFLPAAILSAVPPVVVKLRLATLEQTGTVVGSYSAVGTAGWMWWMWWGSWMSWMSWASSMRSARPGSTQTRPRRTRGRSNRFAHPTPPPRHLRPDRHWSFGAATSLHSRGRWHTTTDHARSLLR